jgi:hypothetical protein
VHTFALAFSHAALILLCFNLPFFCGFFILEIIKRNRYHNAKSITHIIASVVQMLAGDTIAKQ